MFSENDIKNFKLAGEKIEAAKSILLVSHLSPDVDAIASLCFFIDLFKKNDQYFLALADGKNGNYYFLPNEDHIISNKSDLVERIKKDFSVEEDISKNFLKFFDLVVTVDCGSLERTSLTEELTNVKDLMLDTFIIDFDHHMPSQIYSDIQIKIPLASTTEVLYHFATFNNIKIDRNLANCLLAGILTDTANFLYPSVSGKTLEIASEMMALGAQFPKLLNNTWRNKSFLEMKLWGLALANLKVNEKYNIAFSVLPLADLKRFKDEFGQWGLDIFSDIVGFLSSLSEANIVLLLREEDPGKIKGSFRVGVSDNDADVNEIAKIFGGGGHKKASAFVFDGHIIKTENGFQVV